MFRLIIALFLLASPALAAEGSFASLIEQVEAGANPFLQPIVTNERAGMDSLYGSLNAVDGVLYGDNGAGALVIRGQPWKTGESQSIADAAGRTTVELVSVNRGNDERAAVAIFRSADGAQEISIDLPSISSGIDYADEKAGWLIAPQRCITSDKIEAAGLRVKAKGAEYRGALVAQSSTSGLLLVTLETAAALPLKWAPEDYAGVALVIPLHGEVIRVPAQVLSQPPPRENLIGALAATPAGELLGVLGRDGLISPQALGLEPAADGAAITSPFGRRVTFRSSRPGR